MTKQSVYMHWAKTSRFARYGLSTSGVPHYPLDLLGARMEDLQISGPTFYGYEPLQQALAEKSGVSPDCVAAAIGTSMANHLVLAAVLNPGDEVLIEQPAYEPLLAVSEYLQASIKRFARRFEDGYQPDLEQIRQIVTPHTKLIVLTNMHNPSGVFVKSETLKEIGSIAKSVGAFVLVDEVYLECLFPKPGEPYSAFHLGDTFLVTSSLTKAYGLSGLRCGWILAQPELIRKMWRLNDLFSATPSHIAELLSVLALKKLDQIAQRSKKLLNTNRAMVQEFLAQHADDLEYILPEYGTIVFPKLKRVEPDKFLSLLLEKYDTSVVPGSFFDMPDHFRLGFGCPTEVLQEGLHRIHATLQELSNEQ